MSVFDLDPKGQKKTDQQAQLNLIGPSRAPKSTFEGIGEASKSLMQASATAGRSLLTVAGVVPIAWDAVRGAITGKYQDQAQDWWFKHAVDDVGNDAVDAWTPDASQMGSGAEVLSAVGGVVGSVPQLIGSPGLFLTNSAFAPATDLTREGVDAKTALAAGGISLAVSAAGYKLPATFGTSLGTRVAAGVGTNVGLGVASDAATSEVLKAGGYDAQAKSYDFANMKARGIDALMGIAFGLHGHLEHVRQQAALDEMQARTGNTKTDLQDALMTQLNGEHFVSGSLPGEPAHAGALAKGQKALSSAITQILHGEKVSVADMISPDDFIPQNMSGHRPEGNYVSYRRALESGGNPEASNPTSSALGIDQFTDRTWLNTVKEAKPAWAGGLTRNRILAERTDPAKSGAMADVLDADNARALEAAGQPVDNHTLYAAHHFGADEAVAFSKASADTPIEKILTRRQVNANPYLKGKTKTQVIANWDARAEHAGVSPSGEALDTHSAGKYLRKRLLQDQDTLIKEYVKLPGSDGGTVLNTDTARELSPQYLKDRTRSAHVHEAASSFIKMLYARKLSEPTPAGMDPVVRFTAGGTGAGKSSSLASLADGKTPEITYDTNMNSLRSAEQKMQQALDAGRKVQIVYTYRDPVDALVIGALPRAKREELEHGSGRTVPLGEHLRTHTGSLDVIKALSARHAGDPRVKIRSFDNSFGKGQHREVALADLKPLSENTLRENLQYALEAEHQAGRISDATFAGFAAEDLGLGRADKREPQTQRAGRARAGSGDASAGSSGQPDAGRVVRDATAGNPEAGERQQSEGIHHNALTAAQDAVEAHPDLTITLDDGTVVSASAALAQVDADIAKAKSDAKAFSAAASCAMRFNDAL